MHAKGRSFASAVGAILLVLTLGPTGTARAAVASIAVDPPNPTSTDDIVVGISGVFPTSCVPENPTPTVAPGTITIATSNSGAFCPNTATPYSLDVDLGTLGAGLYCLTVTYAQLGPAVNLAEQCFTVADLPSFSGIAKQVGKTPPPNQAGGAIVTISGKFTIGSPATLDLTTSTIKVTGILDENGNELVKSTDTPKLLPVVLSPKHLARTDRAVFESADSVRPKIRMQLRRQTNDVYKFSLKVSRAVIPSTAAACATGPQASLVTSFEILDSSSGDEAQISTRNAWDCQPVTLRASASANSGGSGGSSSNRCDDPSTGAVKGGDAPRTSLRANLLSRDTGKPNLVQLDASGTTPGDGTITDYRFTVFATGSCGVVYGPVHSTDPKIQVTLPTGEYVGSVVVTDSRGSQSKPGQRGFSTP